MEAETVKKVTRYANDFLTGYLVPVDRKTKVFVRKFHIGKLTYKFYNDWSIVY